MLDIVLATLVAVVKPPVSKNAPVDQYFGRFHMSAIRIRLEIDDLASKYERRTKSDGDIMHDALIDEDAMHIWLQQYPNDAWGAPTAFHLAELYAEVQTPAARSAAKAAYTYVTTHYGTSRQGHLARLRLEQGFPPLHAESPLVATPEPSSAATSAPGGAMPGAGSATPAPATSGAPMSSAAPVTSAAPAASGAPAPATSAAPMASAAPVTSASP